ncbi:YaeQ family protein [uncultured Gilvimarinus sp.]|uniref:YaeQ family protein n=1 Tax=uncultured Gilvimarinus sp. TaxID=1689143 RepID=UPI0030ECD24A|tara:strand:- start:447 stop:983 length:537 start_codon:yes stop_codon:yes gene_type:complete
MALGASVYKVHLNLSDTDRHVYNDSKLTLARHPSETEERMMIRLLAYCFNASEDLTFGKGLSTDDEPDLWEVDPAGVIHQWIEVGQPSLDRVKKGRSRSAAQIIYSAGRGRDQWWQANASEFGKLSNLTVWHLNELEVAELATLAAKNMTLSVCIADGSAFISSAEQSVTVTPVGELL